MSALASERSSNLSRDEWSRLLDDVKARADIGSVARELIPNVVANGTRLKALCPFHREKTPSFSVDTAKGVYYCFGCGIGGDVIHLVMAHESMSFREAVLWLADRFSVLVGVGGKVAVDSDDVYERRLAARIAAGERFWVLGDSLDDQEVPSPSGDVNVGDDPYSGIPFPDGFHPIGDPAIPSVNAYAMSRGFSLGELQGLGVGGCLFGRYSGRMVLPVFYRGNLVFWQARDALRRSNVPRYDGPFGRHSSKYLFNLDVAGGFRETVVCEGYFSALRVGQDAVATFGNKISDRQVELLLERGVGRVVLCHDADSWAQPMGEALRGVVREPPIFKTVRKLLGAFGMIRVARLIREDPDDLGTARVRGMIDAAPYVHSMEDFVSRFKLT